MSGKFAGRDFAGADAEGFQLRSLPEFIEMPDGWRRQDMLLNPMCRAPLSSSTMIWPRALLDSVWDDLRDPLIGLIESDALRRALQAADPDSTVVVFSRLIGKISIRRGRFNLSVPDGFEVRGFDITNSWEGLSVLSAQAFDVAEWERLREIAFGQVNEWNLVTSGEIAVELSIEYNRLIPDEGPFMPVLYALCPAKLVMAHTDQL